MMPLIIALWLAYVLGRSVVQTAAFVRVLNTTVLGPDPQTVNRLNGESFQQDALATFNGYQYGVFWQADAQNASIRHATVSRRQIAPRTSAWESLALNDYNQTEDDGHDIITLGISAGDGTIHLGFDQHDNDLNYRVSSAGVATNPGQTAWNASIFGPRLDVLPGLEALNKSIYFINVTYPRFLSVPQPKRGAADLLMELRVGRSGLGDDWLYRYTAHHGWEQTGRYLLGVNNNAYINGLDFDTQKTLHATWTYRDYVNDTGQDVAVQAGPNVAGNNHDLVYAYSHDLGETWHNNWGQPVANSTAGAPILPESPGVTVFSIPKFAGILNQEGQAVDSQGRVHVLNRENATTGPEQWYHYWRDLNLFWTRTAFPLNLPSVNNITNNLTVTGKRGKLIAAPGKKGAHATIFALLPSNAVNSTALSLLASNASSRFTNWQVVWEAPSGSAGEPLYDRYRLADDGVLSLYLVNGTNVSVVDLDVDAFVE